ncbi:MAG: NADH-ubiquinone oxidoreductase chain I, partial [uncultured Solirubrobacteraceae bacterium]
DLQPRGRRHPRPAQPEAGRRQRHLPRLRRDPARPQDDVRPPARGLEGHRVSGGEGAGLPALPRAPQAAPLRGHRPGEVRGLLAVRGRLPGRLHPRRGRREHARQPRLGRRALRRRLRDQHVALHLLRLLRGGVPVRRDHHGARLRAVGLQPLGSHLHQGDASVRAARPHAVAVGRRV